MNVVVPGHQYQLKNFEGDVHQYIQFIEKRLDSVSGEFKTVQEGTTNEEVLKVLIDRMRFLNTKASCRQNSIVITKLEEALMWLNNRTQERIDRGVENTPKA